MYRYIVLVSYTGTITIISISSYIPQDRLNSILNELKDRTGVSLLSYQVYFKHGMEETIGLYL